MNFAVGLEVKMLCIVAAFISGSSTRKMSKMLDLLVAEEQQQHQQQQHDEVWGLFGCGSLLRHWFRGNNKM